MGAPDFDQVEIGSIEPAHNSALASIIRDTLAEFGANHPGTVYFDPTTDHLYELFRHPGSIYYVASWKGKIMGGAGIFPSPGLPADTAELVKMYLLPQVRGMGIGKKLISLCIDFARSQGFSKIYLETMPELVKAVQVYENLGFEYLKSPMGQTGHYGCAIWMLKNI